VLGRVDAGREAAGPHTDEVHAQLRDTPSLSSFMDGCACLDSLPVSNRAEAHAAKDK
jgi:hypothetical protein